MRIKQTENLKPRLRIKPHRRRAYYADLLAGYHFTDEAAGSKSNDREEPVLIVAEFTNNHLGDLLRLKKMIRLAKEAGADLIKVQKRNVETFYTEDELNSRYDSPFGCTLGDYRRRVELNETGFVFLDRICKQYDIGWFCSVLDTDSFEFIKKFNPSMIKIPSTVSNHHNFHRIISNKYHGDIVISTGYTDKKYEDHILNLFAKNSRIYLLQCTSAYPTSDDDCQVGVVRHYYKLKSIFSNIYPGYSSHDNGSLASALAVASGAKMIEKHVKLGNEDWTHFNHVALDLSTDEFKDFVRDVRRAELMVGSEHKSIKSAEHHKYKVNKVHN